MMRGELLAFVGGGAEDDMRTIVLFRTVFLGNVARLWVLVAERVLSSALARCSRLSQPKTMATILAPVGDRSVVKCDFCSMNQFPASNNLCRRCHINLDEFPGQPEPAAATPTAPVLLPPLLARWPSELLPDTLRTIRLQKGLSQRQLAGKMGLPRSYVSKCETRKAVPTLRSLYRLADALGLHVIDLITGAASIRDLEIKELVEDPFIASLTQFTAKLSHTQRQQVLAQLHSMTATRRTA